MLNGYILLGMKWTTEDIISTCPSSANNNPRNLIFARDSIFQRSGFLFSITIKIYHLPFEMSTPIRFFHESLSHHHHSSSARQCDLLLVCIICTSDVESRRSNFLSETPFPPLFGTHPWIILCSTDRVIVA